MDWLWKEFEAFPKFGDGRLAGAGWKNFRRDCCEGSTMFELNNGCGSGSDSSTTGEDAAALFWAENSQRRVLSILSHDQQMVLALAPCRGDWLGEWCQELGKRHTVYSLVIWPVVTETLSSPTV